jgi:hypothetical protein
LLLCAAYGKGEKQLCVRANTLCHEEAQVCFVQNGLGTVPGILEAFRAAMESEKVLQNDHKTEQGKRSKN